MGSCSDGVASEKSSQSPTMPVASTTTSRRAGVRFDSNSVHRPSVRARSVASFSPSADERAEETRRRAQRVGGTVGEERGRSMSLRRAGMARAKELNANSALPPPLAAGSHSACEGDESVHRE